MTESSSERSRHRRRAPASETRSLLVNGERLRLDLSAPKRAYQPGFKPYTLEETLARLVPQVRELNEIATSIPNALRGDSVIIEATLVPQSLAASSFPGRLFEEAGLRHVGTRPGAAPKVNRDGSIEEAVQTKTVFLTLEDRSAGLDKLAEVLRAPEAKKYPRRVRDEVLAVQQFSLPRPELRVDVGDDPAQQQLLEVVLHPQLSRSGLLRPMSDEAVERLAAFVAGLGGDLEREWVRSAGALSFVPVHLAPDKIEQLATHNALRAVHALPRMRDVPNTVVTQLPLLQPAETASAAADNALRVAVFDGGVDDQSPYWQGRVTNIVLGTVIRNSTYRDHGTLVTSALLYGHLGGGATELPLPANMKIDHYEVVPQAGSAGDFNMYWLLDTIEDVLRSEDHYDVVTVCVAPHLLVDESLVNRWTSTIDQLAYELDTLFVVAAGNNGDQNAAGGFNRVLVPADGANVLAIGAAQETDRPSDRTSYSAVGPGRPMASIRPSGLAFGGTAGGPFIGTSSDGTILTNYGTSFAAPLVGHSLASLRDMIGDSRLSAVTMRAFANHFAQSGRGHDPYNVGHGHFPGDYQFLHQVAENEAHVLYSGTIARDEFVSLNLPVPDNSTGKMSVAMTLVTSTDVDPMDAVDYTKATLDVTYRPHARRYTVTKKGERDTKLHTGTDAALFQRLLADGWEIRADPDTESIFGPRRSTARDEASLRIDGKWDSVRAGSHRYNKAEDKLFRPRLDITHLARDGGSLVRDVEDLDWALLVSLTGAAGSGLYSAVRNQYDVLVPLATATVRVGA